MRYYHELFADEPLVQSERRTRILLGGLFVPYPFENGLGALPAGDRARCLDGLVPAALARAGGARQASPLDSVKSDEPGEVMDDSSQDLIDRMRDMEQSGHIDMGAFAGEPNHGRRG